MVGHALGVIAGRHRDHAAPALFVTQLQEGVERAAFLERTRDLARLELEKHVTTGKVRERARAAGRRAHDTAAQALDCGLHGAALFGGGRNHRVCFGFWRKSASYDAG